MKRKLTQEEIDHIKAHGKHCIKLCIQHKMWECEDENCSMHVFYDDFTDLEINASVKLLSRFVHLTKDEQTIQVFTHLVGEQQRRFAQTEK